MSKQHISRLAAIMVAKGIEQVVVSPGSRNAPVIILFAANPQLHLLSVADERSAAFFALGLAIQSGKSVALLCTSGSAVLNYAPAIAEAYYQKVPLLVITADRPIELIDQGDSQTIRQQNIYANYIRKSFNLPVEVKSANDEWYFDRIVNEAIDRTLYPAPGPVQLNLPLDEPLYDIDTNVTGIQPRIIEYIAGKVNLDPMHLDLLVKKWNSASSKLIIAGQMSPLNGSTGKLLAALAKDPTVVVLTECTSNLPNPGFINCIDRTLAQIPVDKNDEFKPQILITLGGAIVSKKVKAMLRSMHPEQHWHINPDTDDFHFDTYKSLTITLSLKPEDFLQQLLESLNHSKPVKKDQSEMMSYSARWKEADRISTERHEKFLANLPFSDMKAYEHIFANLPEGTGLHLGNSTPVRYGQLFTHKQGIAFYGNRGTSGIDGCASTAAGFAIKHKGLTLVITGDIGFFYDSNALWNNNIKESFRVIVINNGGGNIFRIIDGPTGYDELEPFIETRHHLETSGIAANFNFEYFRADNEESLKEKLPLFLAAQPSGRPALLEVVTDNIISSNTLKEYFRYLKKNDD